MTYTPSQIDALCTLAGIREGTRIRSAMHLMLADDGLSLNGAARELGIQPSAVHSAAHRVYNALRLISVVKP